MKTVVNIFRLIVQICFITHLFGCLWILIGLISFNEHDDGWIKYNVEESQIQRDEFFSLYISSVYWVITTISSVGFGDICGHTMHENLFQIFVEMCGLAIFGYLTGTF